MDIGERGKEGLKKERMSDFVTLKRSFKTQITGISFFFFEMFVVGEIPYAMTDCGVSK